MSKLKDKVVLIVDDDPRNLMAMESYLDTIPMKVVTAENGSVALSVLKNMGVAVDIILLDMMMPVMDGFETLEALDADIILKHIPVIAVTAKAMKGDKEKCLEAGALDYVSKPVDMKILIEKMNNYIS